jgi:hypothetical protein
MKHPLSMPEIRQIEGYNKTIVDEIITWDGSNNTVYVDVPLTRMLVPTVIAVKSTPAVSLSLEHYFADEEAQSAVTIGEEEGGQVTITAADEGDLGYTVQVVLPEPADPVEATDLAVAFDEETGVLTITLAIDATGEPDADKNTAAAIAAAVALEDEFTATATKAGVVGEGEYEFTGGIVPWWVDTTDPDGDPYALPIGAGGSGVFGPFDFWPRGLKGRIKVTATTPDENSTTRILVQGV